MYSVFLHNKNSNYILETICLDDSACLWPVGGLRGALVLAVALSIAASGGGQSVKLVTEQEVLLHTHSQALLLWGKGPSLGHKPAPFSALLTRARAGDLAAF